MLSFSLDNKYLETNIGPLYLHLISAFLWPFELMGSGNIFVNRSWITWNTQNLLWLPFDYRGICSAVQGNILVIGQSSGQVNFMEFGFSVD
jgi:hypothetical protein